MDPSDLKDMILGSRIIFEARGGIKKPLNEEKITINFAFASVCSATDIQIGQKLHDKNICLKRPGNGFFSVKDFDKLLGKKAKRFIKKNTQIKKIDLI